MINTFQKKKKPEYQSTFSNRPVQSLAGGGIRYASGSTIPTPTSVLKGGNKPQGQTIAQTQAKPQTFGYNFSAITKPKEQTQTYTPPSQPSAPTPDARTQRFGEEQAFMKQYGQVQNEAFDNSRKFMESQRPYYEEGIKREEDLANQRLAEIDRRQGQDVEATQEQADMSARNLSKTKQVTDVQRTNQFANLGTLESTGYFGYTGQQTNADQQFMTDQANLEKERTRVIGDIRAQSQADRMTVQQQMNQSVAQYRSELDRINYELANNETARKQATLELQEQLRQRLYAVADEFDQRETQRQQQEQELALQDKKLANDMELQRMKVGTGAGGEAEKNKGKVVDTIQRLASGNIAGITGFGRLNPANALWGSEAQQTSNDWETLKGMLSLEARGQLAGSGAISDFESRVLERASNLGLGTNLSEQQFRTRLQILLDEVQDGQYDDPIQGSQGTGAFNIDGYIVEPI